MPKEPNCGRMTTGCGVGMEALGSPIWAHAMEPPFITTWRRTRGGSGVDSVKRTRVKSVKCEAAGLTSGLAPKKEGFHSTMSASLPTSARTGDQKLRTSAAAGAAPKVHG